MYGIVIYGERGRKENTFWDSHPGDLLEIGKADLFLSKNCLEFFVLDHFQILGLIVCFAHRLVVSVLVPKRVEVDLILLPNGLVPALGRLSFRFLFTRSYSFNVLFSLFLEPALITIPVLVGIPIG